MHTETMLADGPNAHEKDYDPANNLSAGSKIAMNLIGRLFSDANDRCDGRRSALVEHGGDVDAG